MICREIKWRSPYSAFAPLAGEVHAHLLHGGDLSSAAEWSVIAAFPEDVLTLEGQDGDAWLQALQAKLNERALEREALPCDAPLLSGLVGYVGYEALAALEPSLRLPPSPYGFADAVFGAYDATAVFSRQKRRAWIAGRSEKACARLEAALGDNDALPVKPPPFTSLTSNFSRRDYVAAVDDITARIRNGDFYQTNIAQCLSAKTDAPFSPFDLFRFIAGGSDSFFGAFLQYEQGGILSNSPERFFQVPPMGNAPNRIVVEPIKGTRSRAAFADEDARLARELQDDPKDRAENIMIADLMRNDLSKICKDYSIREDAICELMSLSRVHHLVSRISGELQEGVSLTDILRALFPSGSITGAPKIEAMRAIAKVEGVGRGPYCGAIGYIDDGGGADFAVAIRTMMTGDAGQRLSVPVGGGVTLRSEPKAEYEETLIKASGALGGAIDPWRYLS
ncbi:MAG: anthranilate synthase component I family protein [Pseudomonadota bacterium]